MATEAQIKNFLEEKHLTVEQVDEMFKDWATFNSTVKYWVDKNEPWQNLNINWLKNIDTERSRYEKEERLKAIEEQQIEEAERKMKEEEDYYWEHFEDIIVSKIDNKEKLDEEELRELALNRGDILEDTERGEWTTSVTTIFEMKNRIFAVDWERGNTEMQENEFYSQPYEVEEREVVKTTIEYVRKK